MSELKPCPFCGEDEYLQTGKVKNPDSFWDSGMRGEEYYYIICYGCNLIMKNDFQDELVENWNRREQHG